MYWIGGWEDRALNRCWLRSLSLSCTVLTCITLISTGQSHRCCSVRFGSPLENWNDAHRQSKFFSWIFIWGCIIWEWSQPFVLSFFLSFLTNVTSFPSQRHIIRPTSTPAAEARDRKIAERNRWSPFFFFFSFRGEKKSMDALRRSYKSTWCVGP